MSGIVVPLLCSLFWLAAFAAGTRTDHVYLFLTPTALLCGGLVFWQQPELRQRLHGGLVDVGIGVVVGVGSLAATYGLFPLVVSVMPGLQSEVVELYRVASLPRLAMPVLLVVAAAEELIWRGTLLAALLPLCARFGRGGPVVAVVLAAVVYAVAQAGSGSPWLVFAGVSFGVVWGGLVAWRGNLVSALLAHLIWTPVVLSLAPLVRLAAAQ